MRLKCKNTLHKVTCILSQDGLQNWCRLLYLAIAPFFRDHAASVRRSESPQEMLKVYIEAAKGSFMAPSYASMCMLESMQTFAI